jgi:hypothetical protein
MLRLVVVAVAAILAGSGIVLILCGVSAPGWQALCVGAVVLLGTLFERWRYRQPVDSVDRQWQSTGERFLDPSTGEPLEVYYNARTGERRYVATKPPPT